MTLGIMHYFFSKSLIFLLTFVKNNDNIVTNPMG